MINFSGRPSERNQMFSPNTANNNTYTNPFFPLPKQHHEEEDDEDEGDNNQKAEVNSMSDKELNVKPMHAVIDFQTFDKEEADESDHTLE